MTRLEQLWQSGELARVAQGATSWNEVARRLGWTENALKRQRVRIREAGRKEPRLDALGADIGKPDISDFADEPTNPTRSNLLQDKWPNVAAFDEADVPLPAIPDGFRVDKISTLVDASTGESKLQWLKVSNESAIDPVKVIRDAFGDNAPLAPLIAAPEHVADDLLVVYGIGDPHIGMLAWEAETGENFDLDIAERHIFGAVDNLAGRVPAAGTGLVMSVGDTLHSDGPRNSTTKGTPVDVDGRTFKMITTAVRTFKRSVYRALERHRDVHVKIARGNHDETMSMVLTIALVEHFHGNPRVHIDASPAFWHWFEFGQNFIGLTHGHRTKALDSMAVMAATNPLAWGRTKHRRIYKGHYHHDITKEVPGVIVDYLPTLAAKEAYAAAHGYIAGRSMRADVFHRARGHIERHMVSVDMLEECDA